ncbi:hypothetical protein KHA96_03925 [Bacillus sp. FJAT-49711]|uniref:hypothetical protein n=1 Tax=Bacillus sp. FJAT-49711 TaxID=2833585 RepID=UPI001BC90F01|nr:hypothetical protein [Bacillus sp. FJAT-49711]MBS4217459.1 hypothetical protein [Bacillus sp. FJAT-49711]
MKKFFRNPSKVSLISLEATIGVFILQLLIPTIVDKVLGPISLIFLMLNPIFGFIYSFFIKGKRKVIYILLHLACICTISFFALTVIIFRFFAHFAP